MNAMNRPMRWALALAALLLPAAAARADHSIMVGKKCSTDGSVLVAHVEEMGPSSYLNLRKVPRRQFEDGATVTLTGGAKIPQVRETYAYLWDEDPGSSISDSCINEWGVMVTSDHAFYQTKEMPGPIVSGGVSYLLRRIVAERAKTARQAIEIAGEIVSKVGYTSNQTLITADADEAWILQMTGTKWLARRCPEDAVVVVEAVGTFQGPWDPADRENWIAAPGLMEYAVQRGWYDPAKGEPFRFEAVYFGADPKKDGRRYAMSLLLGRKVQTEPDGWFPFAIRPPKKLGIKDLLPVVRDHAHWICNSSRIAAQVCQLRRDMPPGIAAVNWRGASEPCTSVAVPWYVGITEVPQEYAQPGDMATVLTLEHHFNVAPRMEPSYAFQTMRALRDAVAVDRAKRLKVVRKTFDAMEDQWLADQPRVEAEAMRLYRADPAAAMKYLTDYCRKAAQQAVDTAEKLRAGFAQTDRR